MGAAALFLGLAGCAGGGSTTPVCTAGRVNVDGVCANELVADYVACVRAQGAQLGEDKSRKLSAEAGYAGARASVASDVKDTLEKKYSASDAAVLEIVRMCSAVAREGGARHGSPAAAPIETADMKGSKAASAGPAISNEATGAKGYELFYDGSRGGFEPNWSRTQGLENCRWNTRTYPDKKVACYFDGQKLTP